MKQVYIGYHDISNSSISALNVLKNLLLKKKPEQVQVEVLKNMEIVHFKDFQFILFQEQEEEEEIVEILTLFFNSFHEETFNVLSCCLEDKNGKLKVSHSHESHTFLRTLS
jgi:hypothetical protein